MPLPSGCLSGTVITRKMWTPRHDRVTKFNLYQQAGVHEYWIVDPDGKSVQVFVLSGGHYAAKDFGTAKDTIKVNVLEDCIIDLSQVFSK